MTVRIGIAGITGRLGREIVATAADDPNVAVAGGVSRSDGSLDDLLPLVDVMIDVTRPDATVAFAECCAEAGDSVRHRHDRARCGSNPSDLPWPRSGFPSLPRAI